MCVFDRRRRYAHDAGYCSLFTGEILTHAREIYGPLSADAELLARAA
jgi:hypothetical protein